MSERIELHGWNEVILPTRAILDLSAPALRTYAYLIFRARTDGMTWVGNKKAADELGIKESTLRRHYRELSEAKYIHRVAGDKDTLDTYVFKSPEDYDRVIKNDPPSKNDRGGGSKMIGGGDQKRSPTDHTVTEDSYTEDTENNHPPQTPRESTGGKEGEEVSENENNTDSPEDRLTALMGDAVSADWIAEALAIAALNDAREPCNYAAAVLRRWQQDGKDTNPGKRGAAQQDGLTLDYYLSDGYDGNVEY